MDGKAMSRDNDAAELVTAARMGDAIAWRKLVDSYSGMLSMRAQSLLLSREDTQDVVQTTWLRAIQHIGQLKQEDRLASWLSTIVTRESFKVIQQRRRELCTDDPALGDHAAPDSRLPEREVARKHLAKVLAQLIEGLPRSHQVVFKLLCATPEMPYSDIAQATGRPIGSIGPTRARCLKRLRVLLQRHGIGLDFLD
jgi:RNA polymerase sigma factor (sigma-70 family)